MFSASAFRFTRERVACLLRGETNEPRRPGEIYRNIQRRDRTQLYFLLMLWLWGVLYSVYSSYMRNMLAFCAECERSICPHGTVCPARGSAEGTPGSRVGVPSPHRPCSSQPHACTPDTSSCRESTIDVLAPSVCESSAPPTLSPARASPRPSPLPPLPPTPLGCTLIATATIAPRAQSPLHSSPFAMGRCRHRRLAVWRPTLSAVTGALPLRDAAAVSNAHAALAALGSGAATTAVAD